MENKVGMLFFRVICLHHQQAAGHPQVQDYFITTAETENQKFPSTVYFSEKLTGNSSAKFISRWVRDYFRAADRDLLNGKPLYL